MLFIVTEPLRYKPQPHQGSSNNWLRVVPRTQFGSFARGAKVTAFTSQSGAHMRIIDGGSGYLCEMEPVAHFGLGNFLYTMSFIGTERKCDKQTNISYLRYNM